jgi:hypothetical protein
MTRRSGTARDATIFAARDDAAKPLTAFVAARVLRPIFEAAAGRARQLSAGMLRASMAADAADSSSCRAGAAAHGDATRGEFPRARYVRALRL